MSDHLQVEVRDAGTACVLALAGELDLGSAPTLVQRAEALLAAGRALVVDLRDLSFMDSTGLGAIAGVERSARKAGTTLSLVAGPSQVQRVFEISGTTDAFTWSEPPDERV